MSVAAHRTACQGFSAVVAQVGDRWGNPSPCPEWDARGVVEHVIGFHDVLLLRPLDAKPTRPRDDVEARWAVTEQAILKVLAGPPPDAPVPLALLTTDVLVHTWDLARAIGEPVDLDPDLCATALAAAQRNESEVRSSSMFGPALPVPADAGVDLQLVAFLGRDPAWGA